MDAIKIEGACCMEELIVSEEKPDMAQGPRTARTRETPFTRTWCICGRTTAITPVGAIIYCHTAECILQGESGHLFAELSEFQKEEFLAAALDPLNGKDTVTKVIAKKPADPEEYMKASNAEVSYVRTVVEPMQRRRRRTGRGGGRVGGSFGGFRRG